MNINFLLAFSEVIIQDRMRQSYAQSHSVLQWRLITHTISTETGTNVQLFLFISLLEYFSGFDLFQAWTWQLVMLQIYVALWGSWFVCVDKHNMHFDENG